MLKNLKKGFTLVELLIVIALIAAIALIVIAAINPIEQANRARDTAFNADSGQLVSAIERYYSARSEFPWVTTAGTTSNDVAWAFVPAGNLNIGVCGTATCTTDGTLITSQELKQEFRNRDFITDSAGADNTKKIYIGKAAGSSASVYACYIPSSTATRQKGCAEGDVYTLGAAGTRTAVPAATCASATYDWDGTGADLSGAYVCLPQ